MTKRFEHFHLSMIERDQPDLLVVPMTRELWLRQRLNQRLIFRHMGKLLHWVPKDWSDELITAIVERKRAKTQHFEPNEGGDEYVGEEWQGSIVIIDPRHRPGGQKLAIEDDPAVGQPGAILTSLVSHLNQEQPSQYALHFKPLIREGSFARFAEKHGGTLQYVSFKFTVPNMIFGAESKTETGLKRIGKETGAQEVELKLESDDGVRADALSVTEAVGYAEEGNARITAKARNGDYWTSTSQRVAVKMHSILNFASETKARIQEWLSEALERDPDNRDPGPDSTNAELDSPERPTPVPPER